MREVFADTSHFVAVLHPSDQLHLKAIEAELRLAEVRIVTSDFVFSEVLNYFSNFPEHLKRQIAAAVQVLLADPEVDVIECSRSGFRAGFGLYSKRLDHGYSLTDCTSMEFMKAREITHILTNDRHFEQEGFQILL